MRQVTVQVPRGAGERMAAVATEFGASTFTRVEGDSGDGRPVDLLVMTVPNGNVGALIERARELGPTEASVPATGTFAFEPPAGRSPEELLDVTPRSGHEVVLAGRQAAGGWRGFITYAAVAGAVVWLGLITETIYLLTGAMLIAPFAGPAMNTAIAMVSGRAGLLRHSIVRYLAGIAVTAAIAGGLSLAVRQQFVTGLMADVLTVSAAAVLLPLAAGAAGATYLVQSEHSSLISGAAVGILVAASLAPPAGGLGMAAALGRWDLVVHAVFLIALQLSGITVMAVVVLWLYGIRPGTWFAPDRPRLLRLGLGAAAVVTVVLLGLQLMTAPLLLQDSRAREAGETAAAALREHGEVRLLAVEPRVASADPEGEPRIIVEAMVERRRAEGGGPDLRAELTRQVRGRLGDELPDVVPHVVMTVVEPR